MGGRGGSSGLSANRTIYEMRTRGQITKYEAVADWGVVEHEGKVWYIMYAL